MQNKDIVRFIEDSWRKTSLILALMLLSGCFNISQSRENELPTKILITACKEESDLGGCGKGYEPIRDLEMDFVVITTNDIATDKMTQVTDRKGQIKYELPSGLIAKDVIILRTEKSEGDALASDCRKTLLELDQPRSTLKLDFWLYTCSLQAGLEIDTSPLVSPQ